jgi:hypothetical protein
LVFSKELCIPFKRKYRKFNSVLYVIVGSEVLTAVIRKGSISWDITPCGQMKVNDVSEEHVAAIFRIEE